MKPLVKSPAARSPASRTRRAREQPAAERPAPTISTEDYLERIGELIERKGYARVVDIAAVLEVSQPSVTAMVQRLAEAGYLNYEKYRGLVMTEAGRAVGQRVRDRHAALQRFLSLLGLDAETQETDIEGWEHCLSAATLARLVELADFLETNPTVLAAFRRGSRGTGLAPVARSKARRVSPTPHKAT
jgi:Mn-dependent DtxR family transcriptional regulator